VPKKKSIYDILNTKLNKSNSKSKTSQHSELNTENKLSKIHSCTVGLDKLLLLNFYN